MLDAVIVGGGPAGATAALALARLGRSALLVDAARPGSARVGEALPAAAKPLLRDLGVLDLAADGGHLECLGNVSIWASTTPTVHDFLRDPNGTGWHLDRRRFDQDMRASAVRAGARMLDGTRVLKVRSTDGGWQVGLRKADGSNTRIRCAWLVDATGRGSVVARSLGAVRRRDDRLVAFVAQCRPAPGAAPDRDARTWVEAVADGWWYTAPLPSGERIVAFHTDADIGNAATLRTTSGLAAGLSRASNLAALLAAHGYTIAGRPRGLDASSARLDPITGEGWLAVGDAAVSLDPLSSQGLLNALYTGLRAAEAVHGALGGDDSSTAAYASRVQEIYRAYWDHRSSYYSDAARRRWPGHPFWERRVGSAAAPASMRIR